ncbi:MAG: hypothetical protein ACLU98_01550 [Desulfovibrio fairfieldensis]
MDYQEERWIKSWIEMAIKAERRSIDSKIIEEMCNIKTQLCEKEWKIREEQREESNLRAKLLITFLIGVMMGCVLTKMLTVIAAH